MAGLCEITGTQQTLDLPVLFCSGTNIQFPNKFCERGAKPRLISDGGVKTLPIPWSRVRFALLPYIRRAIY